MALQLTRNGGSAGGVFLYCTDSLRGCVGVLVWPSGLDLGLGLGQVTGAASSYPLRTDCTAVHLVHCTYLH